VPVEQLQHPRRLAERHGVLDLRPVERIGQPDPPVVDKRVEGPLHRLLDDPGQAQRVLFGGETRHTLNLLLALPPPNSRILAYGRVTAGEFTEHRRQKPSFFI
jgi:hypothetical protein